MKDNKKKKEYEVPALTVVTFKTELGYASSGMVGATRGGYTNDGDDANDQSGNNQSWF